MTDITPTQRRRVDWDAVERDYRTAKFTQRELAEKYGVSHGAIGKRSREKGWQKDLAAEIRLATNAKLTQEMVASEVAKGSQEVSSAIAIAAEVNTRIILKHQRKLSELHELVEFAKAKLEQMGDALVDVKEASTFVRATGHLAAATKTLIEQERKAFGLDDDGKKASDSVDDLIKRLDA